MDAEAIRREAPAVASVSYLIRQMGQVQYANQNWTDEHPGRQSPIIRPSPIGKSPKDAAFRQTTTTSAALVAVLGQTVFRQLFGATGNPIGAVIQVKSVPLRVVGVLASKGQTPFGTDQDDVVMIPFTTARAQGPRRRRARASSRSPSTGSIRRRPIHTISSSA